MDLNDRLEEAIKQNKRYDVADLIDLGADPSFNRNYPLYLAVKYKRLGIVEFLLRDQRVNPGDNRDMAFRTAAEEGDVTILQRLLQDSRVDPMADDNYAMHIAVMDDKSEIVDILARIPGLLVAMVKVFMKRKKFTLIFKLARMTGMDPEGDNLDYMAWAAAIGSLKLIQNLTSIVKLSPEDKQFLIASAQHYGHTNIVNYLQKLQQIF